MTTPTPELLTLADAREAAASAGTPAGELSNDALVQKYIDAVVPVIEDLSRPVAQLDRSRTCDGGREAIMLPWPFTAVVSVVESGATLTDGDYVPAGEVGIMYRGSSLSPRMWTAGRRNVVVTVTVGVAKVPGNQKLAAGLLFAHLWRTRQGPRPQFGQGGGDVVYTPAGFAVPNAVAELLVATPKLPGFA